MAEINALIADAGLDTLNVDQSPSPDTTRLPGASTDAVPDEAASAVRSLGMSGTSYLMEV